AQLHNIPVFQPKTIRDDNVQNAMRALQADVMVVVAYGSLLPKSILSIPRLGCVNVHPSLLPRWRGAAPIARAIEAGDSETGVTIMQMDAGLDTGPMLLEESLAIAADDTTARLTERLADLGARLMLRALNSIATLIPRPQPLIDVNYAHKITKSEAA